MASVMQKSKARHELDIALGKERVKLSRLTERELDKLVGDILQAVEPHELCELEPIGKLLTFNRQDSALGWHSPDVRHLTIADSVSVSSYKVPDTVSLETPAGRLSRYLYDEQGLWKRPETGEETDDYKVALQWRDAFRATGSGFFLLMRRRRDRVRADASLLTAQFSYVKVPLKREHKITQITLEDLPIEKLRPLFGKSFESVVDEIVTNIDWLYSRTVAHLESKTERFRRQQEEFGRLKKSIC